MKKHMIAIMLSLAMAVGCISSSSVFAAETAGETPAAESPVEETAGEELAVPEGTEEELAVPEGTGEELAVQEGTGEELAVQEVTDKDLTLPETTGEAALQEEQEELSEATEPEQTGGVQDEDIGIIETDEPAQLEENREAESAGGDDVEQAIWTEGNKTLTFYYGPLFSAGDSFRGETVTNV